MNNILKAWNAGFVRRWHTHPELCDTIDYDSGHQQRCVVLLLLFWPDATRESIIDTIIHDQGECDAGDLAGPAKARNPEVRTLLQAVEDESIIEQGFTGYNTTHFEHKRRKFVDLLDSYIWMLRHKPQLRLKIQWKEQRAYLADQAEELKVGYVFLEFIASAEIFYAP